MVKLAPELVFRHVVVLYSLHGGAWGCAKTYSSMIFFMSLKHKALLRRITPVGFLLYKPSYSARGFLLFRHTRVLSISSHYEILTGSPGRVHNLYVTHKMNLNNLGLFHKHMLVRFQQK